MLADALHDVVSPRPHQVGDVFRGIRFFEREFGMLVQMMAPCL